MCSVLYDSRELYDVLISACFWTISSEPNHPMINNACATLHITKLSNANQRHAEYATIYYAASTRSEARVAQRTGIHLTPTICF